MVRRFLAVSLGFCLSFLALAGPEAMAATKQEKQAKAAKTAELAPEVTPLLHQSSFPSPAKADKAIEIQYVVYFGGFHLATLDFVGTLTDGKYEIRSAIVTEGVADALVRTTADIGSQGRIVDRMVQPTFYNSDITDTNQRQLVALPYEDILPGQVNAFPEYNLEKYPVTEEQKRATVDPISAIMYILQGSSATPENPCGQTIPIFDGRRRFDILLEHVEDGTVSTGKKGAYNGEAMKCWIGYKKVAGFKPPKKKRRANQEESKSDWPDVHMWLAKMSDEELLVPVRIQSETSFGIFIARAMKLNIIDPSELASEPSLMSEPGTTTQ
jgi:hypothetical protein